MREIMLKIGIIAICIIVFIIIIFVIRLIIFTYKDYIHLDLYIVEPNGDIVAKNGIVYKPHEKLTNDFMNGDLKGEKMIGRVNGDGFWGRRIYKLKGINIEKSIALEGLTLKQVYTNTGK